jgi:hypothetical protein
MVDRSALLVRTPGAVLFGFAIGIVAGLAQFGSPPGRSRPPVPAALSPVHSGRVRSGGPHLLNGRAARTVNSSLAALRASTSPAVNPSIMPISRASRAAS